MSFEQDVMTAVMHKLAAAEKKQGPQQDAAPQEQVPQQSAPQQDPTAGIPPELLAQLMGQQGQLPPQGMTPPQGMPSGVDPQQLEALIAQLMGQQQGGMPPQGMPQGMPQG